MKIIILLFFSINSQNFELTKISTLEQKNISSVRGYHHRIIKNKSGGSYEVLVDSKSNKVIKSWNHTRFEKIPRGNIPLPRAYAHKFK